MKEAVFISDLHLGPNHPEITKRFEKFIEWAVLNTTKLYILGDFFHAWVGDDDIEPWSMEIIAKLAWLNDQGVSVYFMHGNRDFLLGKDFVKAAKVKLLKDPSVITLNNEHILLSHGDRYCTKDYAHQLLRLLTRNRIFTYFFLKLPQKIRKNIAKSMRNRAHKQHKSHVVMDVVESSVLSSMTKYKVCKLIHGHTHKPLEAKYSRNNITYIRYVMSDWDDIPSYLCYDEPMGLQMNQLGE